MRIALKLLASGLVAFAALLLWGIGAPLIARFGAAFATNVLATGFFLLLGVAGAFALYRIWSAAPGEGDEGTR